MYVDECDGDRHFELTCVELTDHTWESVSLWS